MSGVLNCINEWHRRACPEPDQRALDVQLGCHFEEFVELLDAVTLYEDDMTAQARNLLDAWAALRDLADGLKVGWYTARIQDRQAFLDGLCDGIVTAVGVGYRAGMNVPEATTEVDISNWSKFDEAGQPIFDERGKVAKGPNYKPPHLKGYF